MGDSAPFPSPAAIARAELFTREQFVYDGETLEPKPAAAKSVDISADKCIYTFHIRPEAKWNNGDPVVVGDFLFSWKRMLESPAEYTYLHYYIKGAEDYVVRNSKNEPADRCLPHGSSRHRICSAALSFRRLPA